MNKSHIGARHPRKEDDRLLRGRGLYTADIQLPDMVHAAFVRSTKAHADLVSVDTQRARTLPGVIAIYTAADLGDGNPPLYNSNPHPALDPRPPRPLATDRVRYVGEPIAVVVAANRYVAEDAAGLVDVHYRPRAAAVEMASAVAEDAPEVHEGSRNHAAEFTVTFGDVEAKFRDAAVIVRGQFTADRASGSPMETRAVVAEYRRFERANGLLTVWSSTQMPHNGRRALAAMLDVPQHEVRFIAPDVGGAFGIKAVFYTEEYLVPWLARELGRPVKWVEDRHEHFVGSAHARAQVHHAELAVAADGTVLALRDDFLHDSGAYTTWGIVVPQLTAPGTIGPYRLTAMRVDCTVVFTNTTPTAAYRGAGRPESTFVIERLMDLAARELRIDPIEIRRRNVIHRDEFPYEFPIIGRDGKKVVYDSGDYHANIDQAVKLFDLDKRRADRAEMREAGRLIGIGCAIALEKSGLGPTEGAMLRVDPQDGAVYVFTGASSSGQGQETTLAQICADGLDVPVDQVRVVMSDTAAFPIGVGAIASRIATVGGNAVALAASSLRRKVLAVAAAELELDEDDLVVRNGHVQDGNDPSRVLSFQELAWRAGMPSPGMTHLKAYGPGLEAVEYFTPPGVVYASATHLALVEVDPATGLVKVLDYAASHDSGTIVNPMIVDGQVQGGIAAGIGSALLETLPYTADGEPATTTYNDYLIPSALDVPDAHIDYIHVPSPFNPLGIKGVGQAGTMPVPACIASAVDDALSTVGDITVDRFPVSPEWIWEALNTARQSRATREPSK